MMYGELSVIIKQMLEWFATNWDTLDKARRIHEDLDCQG